MPRRTLRYLTTVLLTLAALALILGRGRFTNTNVSEERFDAGRFGVIHLYRGEGQPQQLTLLISGDAGWKQDMDGMARALARPGILVAGIDLDHYRNGVNGSGDYCDYPAGTLAALGRELQRRYRFGNAEPPLLAGYAGGATLAYVALAQSPGGTFRGAISIDFQPTLRLTKMLCKGLGSLRWAWRKDGSGMDFQPAESLPAPWVVLQSDAARQENIADFVRGIPQARLETPAGPADTPSAAQTRETALAAASAELFGRPSPSGSMAAGTLDDLPLVDVPAAAAAGTDKDYLAVIVSGDGGWADIDRAIAGTLSTRGIPVLGWDSLHYFWTRRTPDSVGQDLARVLDARLKNRPARRLLLIGYSLGADVLPFMVNRLPAALKDRIALVALLGISPDMDFEFRIADWLPGGQPPTPYPTGPEVARLPPLKVLCVYGAEEDDSLCPRLENPAVIVKRLPGGHHFDGDYQKLTRIILDTAHQPQPAPHPAGRLTPPPT